MTATPELIEAAEFETVKRGGYRTEQVDRFLRTLADEHREMLSRLRVAEGANEDLAAASAEMATLMRDVHSQLGERRRQAESEHSELRMNAEREAASIISAATEQADAIRQQADRVLGDAEHHAELLRSDGEQRVREQAAATLRSARSELQELLRRKHELLHSLTTIRTDLAEMETNLEASALSPDALDDSIINQTLVDLREEQDATPAAVEPVPATVAAVQDLASAQAQGIDDGAYDAGYDSASYDTSDEGTSEPAADSVADHPSSPSTSSTFFAPPTD